MSWDTVFDHLIDFLLPPWGWEEVAGPSGGVVRRPRMARVPDVRRMAFDEALSALVREGFEVEVIQVEERPAPVMGTVVAQSPAPGARWRRGRVVTVTVWHPPAEDAEAPGP